MKNASFLSVVFASMATAAAVHSNKAEATMIQINGTVDSLSASSLYITPGSSLSFILDIPDDAVDSNPSSNTGLYQGTADYTIGALSYNNVPFDSLSIHMDDTVDAVGLGTQENNPPPSLVFNFNRSGGELFTNDNPYDVYSIISSNLNSFNPIFTYTDPDGLMAQGHVNSLQVVPTSPVPLPPALPLFGTGLLMLLAARRKGSVVAASDNAASVPSASIG